MFFNFQSWSRATLIFCCLVAMALFLYAVVSLLMSAKHLRKAIDEEETNFVDEYIILYRGIRLLLILISLYFMAGFFYQVIIY